jgi:hypothetical protein
MSRASYNLVKVPGTFAEDNPIILLLKDMDGYSFLIEKIDKNLYEFIICIYDNADKMNRREYVLTVNKKSLRDLKNCIIDNLK